MNKEKGQTLDTAFGIEGVLSYLNRGAEGVNDLVAELAKRDVKPKEHAPDTEAVTSEVDYSPVIEKMAEAYATIVEAQSELDTELQTLKSTDETVTKERDALLADVSKRLEKIETFMLGTPSSGTQERQSNMEKEVAQAIKDKSPAGEYDDFWGGMQVPKEKGGG